MRQDQKCTPTKSASRSAKKRILDEALNKDLLCPFADAFSFGMIANYTPMRKQPEYLLSPSPAKKDLFSQLLGTQRKQNSPFEQNQYAISQEEISMSDMSSESSDSMADQQCSSENQADWSDENGIKKRRRKSTAQIKLLKQEIDGEMNWTKEKIVRMAEVTGLSQSQVYKWCWDQKKKQNKIRQDLCRNYQDKRKLIKKPTGLRNYGRQCDESQSQLMENKQNVKGEFINLQNLSISRHTMTKPKNSVVITDGHDTEKKVSKRLHFH